MKMKSYAHANNVPIICDEGLSFLLKAINDYHVKNILEIGSAIGYSALAMSLEKTVVDSFERDLERYNLAKNFLKEENADVNLIFHDALTYQGNLKKYDLIFIDAAKAQYQKFFDKFEAFLNPNGIIICDNLNFHNLKKDEVSRGTRQLLQKLENFKTFLKENEKYATTFYDVGDGMSISKRKEL